MDIYRLTYRSVPHPSMNWDILSSILEQSLRNNVPDKITGLLMWMDQRFVQVLEGPFDTVNRCFLRVAKDGRHSQVEILAMHVAPSRLFPDWSMRAFNFLGLSDDNKEELRQKHCPGLELVDIPKSEDQAIALMLDSLELCRVNKQSAQLLKSF